MEEVIRPLLESIQNEDVATTKSVYEITLEHVADQVRTLSLNQMLSLGKVDKLRFVLDDIDYHEREINREKYYTIVGNGLLDMMIKYPNLDMDPISEDYPSIWYKFIDHAFTTVREKEKFFTFLGTSAQLAPIMQTLIGYILGFDDAETLEALINSPSYQLDDEDFWAIIIENIKNTTKNNKILKYIITPETDPSVLYQLLKHNLGNRELMEMAFPKLSAENQQEIVNKVIGSPHGKINSIDYLLRQSSVNDVDKRQLISRLSLGLDSIPIIGSIYGSFDRPKTIVRTVTGQNGPRTVTLPNAFYIDEETEKKYRLLRLSHPPLKELIDSIEPLVNQKLSKEQILDQLQTQLEEELQEKYRPESQMETILALYRQQGLIEQSDTLPGYLYPHSIKEETLSKLLKEKNLPLGEATTYQELVNVLKTKNLVKEIQRITSPIDEANQVWVGLSGMAIFKFTFADGKKKNYLMKARSLLVVPFYEELQIEQISKEPLEIVGMA